MRRVDDRDEPDIFRGDPSYVSRRADSNRGPLHYETTASEARLPTGGDARSWSAWKADGLCPETWTREPTPSLPYVPVLYPRRVRRRFVIPGYVRCPLHQAEHWQG